MQVDMTGSHSLLFVLAFFLLSSCCLNSWMNCHDEIQNVEARLNQISIKSCRIHSILLDSATVPIVSYCKAIKNNEPVLSFLNDNNNSIYFYNIETGNMCDKISFPDFEEIQGYYFSKDTLVLYSYFSDKLSIRIRDSTRLLSLGIQDYGLLCPKPFLMTSSPMEVLGDGETLVLPVFLAGIGSLKDEVNRHSVLLYNYKTGIYEYKVPFPDEYYGRNWGGNFAYMQPYLTISEDGRILISFAACHDLFVYDPRLDQNTRYYAGSGLIQKIAPSSIPISHAAGKQKELMEWYYRNPSYEGIHYDPYRHLYYRIARLGLPSERERAHEGNNKPVIVIVLDEKLCYLGECHLPENVLYNSFCAFVAPGGFNIQVINGNEDELLFHELSFSL